jgi:hypothetical protein
MMEPEATYSSGVLVGNWANDRTLSADGHSTRVFRTADCNSFERVVPRSRGAPTAHWRSQAEAAAASV